MRRREFIALLGFLASRVLPRRSRPLRFPGSAFLGSISASKYSNPLCHCLPEIAAPDVILAMAVPAARDSEAATSVA